MTYPRAVLLSWLLALLLALGLAYDMAHAGQLSLDLKGGLVLPIRTTPDGTYWQDVNPHNTRLLTGAWAVGLNYQHTPALSFQTHWLDLGSSRINGTAISDENYDHKNHRCKSGTCIPHYSFKATDSLRGVDATATYTWRRDGLEPFVKGGLAVLQHKAVFRNDTGGADKFDGILPELEVGIGLAYKLVYIEVDYFHGLNFGGQNLPISTQQIVMFAGVHIPIWR